MEEHSAGSYRKATSAIGVYIRTSSKRLFNGVPDSCFDISYQIDNKLIWKKVGWESKGYTLEMAQKMRGERMRAIRAHEFSSVGMPISIPDDGKKIPYFKEVAEHYIAWAKDNKAMGGRDDESRYNKHLAQRFDQKRLNEITPLDLERMKKELKKSGLSVASVEHCLKLFRQIVNKAKAWGLYEGENPIKGVKIPNSQNKRLRFLTYEEADKLLKELAKISMQVHDIALISLHTGMRAGEIFNMKSCDLDFENGIIDIHDSKNGESRKAFMTDTVKTVLKKRLFGVPIDYVFINEKGNRIDQIPYTYVRVVERLGFNKGITDRRYRITFHSFRHTFASWLALQGEPILTIKELLGHKSLEMTLRYAHLVPDQKRQAVMRMERAFRPL